MPDFKRFVRENLPLPPMKRRREEKIIEELALQLADLYRAARARGLDDQQALADALGQIPDWETFASDIASAQRPNLHGAGHRAADDVDAALRRRGGARRVIADLGQDARYALRTLGRRPVFLFATVFTLALGIGANTAIFSVMHAVLLRPLPYAAPDRLVTVWTPWETEPSFNPLSAPDYRDFRDQAAVFEAWGAYTRETMNLAGRDDVVRVAGIACTPGTLEALGVAPALGRLFTTAEAEDPASRVVVVSDRLWRNRFGADPALVGREIVIDKESRTVVGIMPAAFRFPSYGTLSRADLLLPLAVESGTPDRGAYYLFTIGRLREGLALASAEAELGGVAARLARLYPHSNAQRTVRIVPLRTLVLQDAGEQLWPLMGATAVILLLACLNVAALLLARGAGRSTESAVRAALGAGRARLVRQMLTESGVIALFGGGAGLLLAWWGLAALEGTMPSSLPRLDDLRLDGTVLAFTLAATVLTGLVFGLIPAHAASRVDVAPTLRAGAPTGTPGRRQSRTLSLVMVTQFALTFVLANGAFLMLRSLWNATAIQELGDPSHVLIGGYTPDTPKRDWLQERDGFVEDLLERLAAVPGVEAAGATSRLPLMGAGWSGGVLVEGETYDPDTRRQTTYYTCVTPGWFDAMGVRLLQGRFLRPEDLSEGQLRIVVNRTFGDASWPGENPIGKRVRSNSETPWFDAVVVGVVEDVRQNGLEGRIVREIYFPFFPSFASERWVTLRTAGDPLGLVPALRRELAALDPNLALSRVMTGADLYDLAARGRRFSTLLVGLYAVVALLLIMAGVWGVMAFHVAERAHEMGIRVALGADRWRVFGIVMARGLRLVLAGVAMGLAGAAVAAKAVGSQLFGVGPLDPLSLGAVGAFLLLVAFAATLAPALRAVRVDPVTAMRAE